MKNIDNIYHLYGKYEATASSWLVLSTKTNPVQK